MVEQATQAEEQATQAEEQERKLRLEIEKFRTRVTTQFKVGRSSLPDFYLVLGQERTASKYELKKAYRAMIKIFHPDLTARENPSLALLLEEITKLLTQAKANLIDFEEKRRKYDRLTTSALREKFVLGGTSVASVEGNAKSEKEEVDFSEVEYDIDRKDLLAKHIRDGMSGRVLTLGRENNRDYSIDIEFPEEETVSKIHGVLYVSIDEEGKRILHVQDYESTNGTFINGSRLTPREKIELKEGDVLKLGNVSLLFYRGGLYRIKGSKN